MMFKSTSTTYTINCSEIRTNISVNPDYYGIPCIEILEVKSPIDVEFHNKFNLRFHDKKSVEQLIFALQTIKDEMDRFEPNDQPVS